MVQRQRQADLWEANMFYKASSVIDRAVIETNPVSWGGKIPLEKVQPLCVFM